MALVALGFVVGVIVNRIVAGIAWLASEVQGAIDTLFD